MFWNEHDTFNGENNGQDQEDFLQAGVHISQAQIAQFLWLLWTFSANTLKNCSLSNTIKLKQHQICFKWTKNEKWSYTLKEEAKEKTDLSFQSISCHV